MNEELQKKLNELHDRIDAAEERAEAMAITINCLLRSLEDHGISIGDSLKNHMGRAANRYEDRFGAGAAGPIDQLCEELVFGAPSQSDHPKSTGS